MMPGNLRDSAFWPRSRRVCPSATRSAWPERGAGHANRERHRRRRRCCGVCDLLAGASVGRPHVAQIL